MIDLTIFIFLSYFYFIVILLSILRLRIRVSMTSQVTNCHTFGYNHTITCYNTQWFQNTTLSRSFSSEILKEVNRKTPPQKARFNRSITIIKDQVFEGLGLIILPPQKHVIEIRRSWKIDFCQKLNIKFTNSRLSVFSILLFIFIFILFYFLFSIFRTARVRTDWSRCHISHNLMAQL